MELDWYAENNHANIGDRQINVSRYVPRIFRMEQLTRLRQLYTYKYLLTRIKHAHIGWSDIPIKTFAV